MPEIFLPVSDYDLAATLDSGQVFRWVRSPDRPFFWTGVIGLNFVRLEQLENGIHAETFSPQENWNWLKEFLQTEVDLAAILKTFPNDEPMNTAVAACHGLRVLRQDPWECLASFILSSTKQIVQIRQIVSNLCECFGEPLQVGTPRRTLQISERDVPTDLFFSFPSPEKIASLSEAQLRSCKMGFRAPNLLAVAREIAEGKFGLAQIRKMNYADAQHELMKLRGVGKKIADCVLLFAYGFDSAFPVDVWIGRALRQFYFPRRKISEKKLLQFAATHFGPHAGTAQQYLFHYMRTKKE